ncbi:MAG: hypothetical protein A2043_08785 [Candidatus Schekmanbacteria bacterium GWA2_38_9]|uniref:ATP-grasp domain-containing protein n=1 Tax=Candidatus Schekmanbacteria bacterium RIFCSPLOWO2_12_FULL_38_15 TaxID=1817883 RepID=A0A1F7SLW0_9BACT|nr:MAG: hypothetical protein A2043_08785 [Candidatus Schekmanbacteria bacterium GWA2_38_9]OGL51236.1 MAG: hypothetical protein A3H37_10505 [Candidatus Schekmanbacteria bacterium RIFCSPLOWO2_02_FULL_38_14]OGL54187.1 MAG: hypothetical protein A3G31_05345 [Candidatus Schekmanbacteria bacterium RIFCSPLOWO2_12_FULL_38_15]
MKKIILTDANTYATLSVARSLARKGFEIIVGGERATDMSFYSKSVAKKFIYTSPKKSIERFLKDIKKAIDNYSPDMLIPVADKTLIVISEHRADLKAKTFLAQDKHIKTAMNKFETQKLAQSLGIKTPKTIFLNNDQWQSNLLQNAGINFPVAIKACCSADIIGDRVIGGSNTIYSNSEEELLSKLKVFQTRLHKLLVQEFIAGTIIGISGIFKNGNPIALFAYKRIRQTRPIGGPSALAESIALNDTLKTQALPLMRALEWSGPAMLEFKTGKDGEIYLLEINGRFWGSLPLSIFSGVDMPFLYFKSVNDMPVDSSETFYKVGLKGRFFWGDLLNLFLRLRGIPKWWPDISLSRIEALRDFFASFFDEKLVYLDFQSDDIVPFLIRPLSIFNELLF